MAINLAQVENALETGLVLVQKLAPLAALGGPAAGAIGEVVSKLAGAAAQIVPAVENDATIIAGGDPAQIRALQAQLQQQNVALAQQIADS
jgi:hypothetical protein